MESTCSKADEMAGHVKEYVANRVTYAKLSVADKSSVMLSNIIATTISLILVFFCIAFAGVALALFVAKLTGNSYWGFLVVSILYLLLAWFNWRLKNRLFRFPILNGMMNQLTNKEEAVDGKD
ncbi:MAG: phage holin family protein [Sediminibacterium sp.]